MGKRGWTIYSGTLSYRCSRTNIIVPTPTLTKLIAKEPPRLYTAELMGQSMHVYTRAK